MVTSFSQSTGLSSSFCLIVIVLIVPLIQCAPVDESESSLILINDRSKRNIQVETTSTSSSQADSKAISQGVQFPYSFLFPGLSGGSGSGGSGGVGGSISSANDLINSLLSGLSPPLSTGPTSTGTPSIGSSSTGHSSTGPSQVPIFLFPQSASSVSSFAKSSASSSAGSSVLTT